MPVKSGRISDPVHGLIDFTGIERLILHHRVAQRLRYIFQSGLAHLVFPEVRTSRFSHSLGAMHLASRIFAACMRNSSNDARLKVCKAVRELIMSVQGRTAPEEMIKNAAEGLSSNVLIAHTYCTDTSTEDYRADIQFAEQALRLAALFHDLGHLPFSHDFETALEEYHRRLPETQRESSPVHRLLAREHGLTKVHERLGHHVAQLLLMELRETERDGSETIKISFELAHKILTSTELAEGEAATPAKTVAYWLHTLVDGEIDADRCDYLLRDGRNYGFEFATYNLDRLLDNLIVTIAPDHSFVLAIGSRGIAPVESFFLSRYRSYQNGVRHHKVAQISAALRHSIVYLLETAHGRLEDFIETLGDIVGVSQSRISRSERQRLLKQFASFDDIWWMNFMREQLDRKHSDKNSEEWLNLVCWRQPGPRSLWKRASDFPGPLTNWNDQLNELIPTKLDISNVSKDEAQEREKRFNEGRQHWLKVVSSLEQQGVLITRYTHTPWQAASTGKSTLLVVTQDDKLVPMSDLSPLFKGLRDVWRGDLQLQAFATSRCPIEKQDVVNMLVPTNLNKGE